MEMGVTAGGMHRGGWRETYHLPEEKSDPFPRVTSERDCHGSDNEAAAL